MLLVGCTFEHSWTYPDMVDIRRANELQNDPWLAPETVPLSKAYPGKVQRTVVSRQYETSMTAADIALVETEAALQAGWAITGAHCTEVGQDEPGGKRPDGVALTLVGVSLTREGNLDHTAQASIAVVYDIPDQPGGNEHALPPARGGPRPFSTVRVEGIVPHHRDQWWPDSPTLALEDTCLTGTQLDERTTDPEGSLSPGTPDPWNDSLPLVRDEDRSSREKGRPWPSGTPEGLFEAIERAQDDEVLNALGVLEETSTWGVGGKGWKKNHDQRVFPYGMSKQDSVQSTELVDVADRATSDGWRLTYTGCWSSGLTLAELRRPVGKDYSVVLRLTQVADVLEPGQATLTAHAQITSPSWYGPAADSLDTVAQVCATPTDEAFVWQGTAWFGPSQLAPVQAGGR